MNGILHSEGAYRREIDGLRALAILPVMFFHAGFQQFSGGYVGVDVFFVISGYLITSNILRDAQAGRFSMLVFYERRARRILPAIMFMLAACTVMAWWWMTPDELQDYGQGLAAVQVFASNIYFWITTNYFSPAAEELPLLHTWSLAVEEQYYILFPLFLLAALRSGPRRLIWLTLALAVGSLALAEWGARHYPIANFYLLPTRAWELLAGSLLAIGAPTLQRVEGARPWVRQLGAMAGLLLIGGSVFLFDQQTLFPGVLAVVPALGSMLIIVFAKPATQVGALLSSRLLVGIGLVSYSAYLWHQPVLVFSRFTPIDQTNAWVRAGLVATALAMAVVSWALVERPIRQRRWLATRSSVFVASAVGMAALAGIGLALASGDGFPGRGNPAALRAHANEFPTVANGWCFYSVDSIAHLKLGAQGLGCALGDRHGPPRGLLVGDSFAGHFEPFWDLVGNQLQLGVAAINTNWCFPSLKQRYTGPATSRAHAQCLFNRQHIAQTLGHYDVVVVAADWRNVLLQGMLDDAFEFIAQAGRDGRLVIVMPTPKRFGRDAFRRMQRASFFGQPVGVDPGADGEDAMAVQANRRVQQFVQTQRHAIFLGRDQVFQTDGVPSDFTADRISYSADGRHVSIYGSLAAGRAFIRGADFEGIRAAVHAATQGARRH